MLRIRILNLVFFLIYTLSTCCSVLGTVPVPSFVTLVSNLLPFLKYIFYFILLGKKKWKNSVFSVKAGLNLYPDPHWGQILYPDPQWTSLGPKTVAVSRTSLRGHKVSVTRPKISLTGFSKLVITGRLRTRSSRVVDEIWQSVDKI